MNLMKRDLAFLILILCSIFLGLGVSYLAYKTQQKRDVAQQEEIQHRNQLLKQFLGDIEKAKKETGDECSQVFVAYVRPPEEVAGKPVLLVMGQEIYLKTDNLSDRLWRMDYQLIPKGDKVELWKTQWFGVAMPPNNQDVRRQKLAEKYSPDSSRCRAR